jgi:hypothetical protein
MVLYRKAAQEHGYLIPGRFVLSPKKGSSEYKKIMKTFVELKKKAGLE